MKNLIISEKVYYANKDEFTKLYKKLKLKWDKGKSGWYSKDGKSYLLKIPAESGYKRFTAENCQGMVDFLTRIGAKEKKEDLDPATKLLDVDVPENYEFVGADLDSHRRFHRLLDTMPENWNVKWK